MAVSNSLSPLPLTRHIVDTRLWGEDPLFVIDVGASGGLQDHWRVFAGRLRAVGFDPLLAEIDRLNAIEPEPGVRYEAAYVGCRNFDERFPRELRVDRSRTRSNDPWARVSAARVQHLHQQSHQPSYVQQVFNAGAPVVRTERTIALDEYIAPDERKHVDFVKIDTDGHDIEVLLGAEQVLRADAILGVSIEAQFHGPIHEYANTFPNIDRIMRERGFTLFDLEPYRYSRAALPAQFLYDLPAQTVSGQVLWAEATYFRDLADREYESMWSFTRTPERVLKLACLFEVFGLPDCAAELLIERGDVLGVDVRGRLLDLLAGGAPGAYAAHISRFDADYTLWYPGENLSGVSAGEQAVLPPEPIQPAAIRPAEDGGAMADASHPAPPPAARVNRDFDALRQQLAALKEQNAAVRDHLRTGSIVQADTTEQQP